MARVVGRLVFISQLLLSITKLRLIVLGALAGLSLIAVGCGSSSDSNSSAPTKAEFIKRADGVCERTDKAQKVLLKVYFEKHPNATVSKAVKEDVVTLSLPPIRTEAEDLDALSTPNGDEDEVKAIVDAVEEAVDKGEADPSAMVNEKPNGPFAEAKKLAGEYGFKACAFPL